MELTQKIIAMLFAANTALTADIVLKPVPKTEVKLPSGYSCVRNEEDSKIRLYDSRGKNVALFYYGRDGEASYQLYIQGTDSAKKQSQGINLLTKIHECEALMPNPNR